MTGFPGSGPGFPGLWGEMIAQAQKLAREMNPALENFVPRDFDKLWPTLPREMMELLWGDRLNPGGLDARTRLLVVLAGLTVQGAQAEPQFKATLRHALEAGASPKEIAEVILQMSLLGGLPAMGRATAMAEEIFREHAARQAAAGDAGSGGTTQGGTTQNREPGR